MDHFSSKSLNVAILLADISGSTRLYEAVGDAEAQWLISQELARLRTALRDQEGIFVRAKGDDVLGYFEDPEKAFRAVRTMVSQPADSVLSVHAGLNFGPAVLAEGEIFGEAVNLTARLAGLANGGEVLMTRSLLDQLPGSETTGVRPLERIQPKGVSAPIEVFSLVDDESAVRTQSIDVPEAYREKSRSRSQEPKVAVFLTYGDCRRRCREAESLLIGRAKECAILLPHPWISRKHAVVTVRASKVILEDRSAGGTYVTTNGGHEVFLLRESMMLTGKGLLSPAVGIGEPDADPIQFEISRR